MLDFKYRSVDFSWTSKCPWRMKLCLNLRPHIWQENLGSTPHSYCWCRLKDTLFQYNLQHFIHLNTLLDLLDFRGPESKQTLDEVWWILTNNLVKRIHRYSNLKKEEVRVIEHKTIKKLFTEHVIFRAFFRSDWE